MFTSIRASNSFPQDHGVDGLQSSPERVMDLQNFTFATALGYNSPVLQSPVAFTSCNPAYDTEFDENYAAPGSVIQDPTLPAGNLFMLYEAENHCPGGVNQQPYRRVGKE